MQNFAAFNMYLLLLYLFQFIFYFQICSVPKGIDLIMFNYVSNGLNM